jgi:Zn-dependent protease
MEFTKREIRDLLISVLILTLIFSFFRVEAFLEALFIVLVVFIPHEIFGHKLVAQRYGCSAEYRMWLEGLFLGLITALIPFGIVFIAPGAVYISPFVRKKFAFRIAYLSRKEYGIISLAGPLINIVLGTLLFFSSLFYPLEILILASRFSFFLAFFNLIPFPPLDGMKILLWNRKIWLVMIAITFLGFLI